MARAWLPSAVVMLLVSLGGCASAPRRNLEELERKVSAGMTDSQVVAVAGQPDKRHVPPDVKGRVLLTYFDPSDRVVFLMVVLQDNAVIRKGIEGRIR